MTRLKGPSLDNFPTATREGGPARPPAKKPEGAMPPELRHVEALLGIIGAALDSTVATED